MRERPAMLLLMAALGVASVGCGRKEKGLCAKAAACCRSLVDLNAPTDPARAEAAKKSCDVVDRAPPESCAGQMQMWRKSAAVIQRADPRLTPDLEKKLEADCEWKP